jgi:MFS superfamily sulfate permease-like transporter
VRRSEFVLAIATTAGVVFVGLMEGIAIAAGLSLANFVRRAWRPYNVVLGRIEGRKGYHDVERHPEAAQIPGLVIYRFDAPLFFANAEYFASRLREIVATRGEPVRTVVVASEPISDIDTTAAEVLDDLVDALNRDGTDLVFAELKGPVKDRLADYGLAPKLGDHGFPPTLGSAISAYVDRTGVEWVDWEDRPTS